MKKNLTRSQWLILFFIAILVGMISLTVYGLQKNQDPRSRADDSHPTRQLNETFDVPISFTASEEITALEYTIHITNGELQNFVCLNNTRNITVFEQNDNGCIQTTDNGSGMIPGELAIATVRATQLGTLSVVVTGQMSTGNGTAPSSSSFIGGTYNIVNTPDTSPTPTDTPPSPTPTFTPTPTIPTPPPTTPSEIPVLDSTISFSIKFQGVQYAQTGRKINLTLKSTLPNSTPIVITDVPVEPSNATLGVYRGTAVVSDISPGQYDIYVKGNSHLQKRVGTYQINPGNNNFNWATTNQQLIVGDVLGGNPNNLGDNQIRIGDLSSIINLYKDIRVPVSPNTPQDVDFSGDITIRDLALVINNYTAISVPGDPVQ